MIKKTLQKIKKNLILKFEKSIEIPTGDKYFFIALQVHDDTQLIFNSPYIKKPSEILEYFYDDIKKILPDYKIVVKEHPEDIGRINYKNLIKKYSDIIWIKKGNIDDIINKSEYVMCINSSVGFQALSKYKKVITLGECFYNNNPFVENITSKDEFVKKLKKQKDKDLNNKEIDNYINIFKNEIFIDGSGKGWGRENYSKETIRKICEYITN